MATRLDKTLKRELEVEGKLYTVTMAKVKSAPAERSARVLVLLSRMKVII